MTMISARATVLLLAATGCATAAPQTPPPPVRQPAARPAAMTGGLARGPVSYERLVRAEGSRTTGSRTRAPTTDSGSAGWTGSIAAT